MTGTDNKASSPRSAESYAEDDNVTSPRISIPALREQEERYPERSRDTVLLALVEAVEAARGLLDLAAVAHNGDPWYAEQEGMDAGAILRRGSAALARFDFGEET